MALPAIGTPGWGGWIGGYISTSADGVATHALIVCDKAFEVVDNFADSTTRDNGESLIDGPANFAAMISSAVNHPIAEQVKTDLNDAAVAGYTDWYIPAWAELDVLYAELKPTTDSNSTTGLVATNDYSVPKRTVNYTAGDPAQTEIALFQAGGDQSFFNDEAGEGSIYWTSSRRSGSSNGIWVLFSDGDNGNAAMSNVWRVRAIRRVSVDDIGPTTDEELFNASYADASAALPKITALIRPADVQRSIDTDVSSLKDGPNFYTVECIFGLGELDNLNPYNATTEKPRVFFVKDDQPGLRDGKNLLLKGYQIRSADPSVPVTCTFWGY